MLRGFRVITLPPDPSLGEAVSTHPDTLLFRSGNEIITTADYCDAAAYVFSELRECLPGLKISFTSDERGEKYPTDCIMNALVVGNKIFAKLDTLSYAVRDFALEHQMELVHTRQGYPACTTLVFGNNAITADEGMARALTSNGVNVTLIRAGHISLCGCEYGFIGGASGVFGKEVYFFGDVLLHPDGELILDTIRRAGFTPVSLSTAPLTDLGGMIFIE